MLNWLKRLVVGSVCLLFFNTGIHGQNNRENVHVEPILTQYMFNMQPINPAYAGMWEKIGFSTLIRKQWAGLSSTPLTQVLSFHSPLFTENMGFGLNITNDRYGLENKLNLFADYAYEVAFTSQLRMRFGLKFGFINYKNPLTQYQLYPDGQYDEAFAEDVDLKFMPNFGLGGFLYDEHFYIGLSIPKLIKNDYKANINNFNLESQIQTVYIMAGYVFQPVLYPFLVIKPTIMLNYTRDLALNYDVGINFMLYDKLWLGVTNRSANALSFVSQWILDNNLRIGFAMDITYNEIFPYQYGTYEVSLGFDIDFFGRSYIREKYF